MHAGGGVVPRSNTNELLNGPDLATIKCKNRNYDHQLQLDKYQNSIMSILWVCSSRSFYNPLKMCSYIVISILTMNISPYIFISICEYT